MLVCGSMPHNLGRKGSFYIEDSLTESYHVDI